MILTNFEQAKFWSRVDVTTKDGCWEWKGARSAGYGMFRCQGKYLSAHRVAYEIFKGPIPPGFGYHGTVVMHGCDNRRCCNPYHLRLGTNQSNRQDLIRKSTSRRPNGRHLKADIVAQIFSDQRAYRDVALHFGVAISTVCRIKKRMFREQSRGTPRERSGTPIA